MFGWFTKYYVCKVDECLEKDLLCTIIAGRAYLIRELREGFYSCDDIKFLKPLYERYRELPSRENSKYFMHPEVEYEVRQVISSHRNTFVQRFIYTPYAAFPELYWIGTSRAMAKRQKCMMMFNDALKNIENVNAILNMIEMDHERHGGRLISKNLEKAKTRIREMLEKTEL